MTRVPSRLAEHTKLEKRMNSLNTEGYAAAWML